MKLVHYRGRTPNFGDDLNDVIWPALAPELFDGNGALGFVGIGTVIGMPFSNVQGLHVFGSGVGNDPLEPWRRANIRYWCVRGPISARLLGLAPHLAITDGAILTPLVAGYPGAASGGSGTVIVPHWQSLDYPGWDRVAALTGYGLIDPRAEPLDVVKRIVGASLVLTESLHGAIIADTYGIPWIGFATSKNFGTTKWVDWTMSLEMACRLTMVPPPSAKAMVSFGRGRRMYGQSFELNANDAVQEFAERVAPKGLPTQRTFKERVKTVVKRSSWLQPFLGLNPQRTANALLKLAADRPSLSGESIRADRRERMLASLGDVVREYQAGRCAFNRPMATALHC